MAGFLYFVPSDSTALAVDELKKVEFPWPTHARLPGRRFGKGPGGKCGHMFRLPTVNEAGVSAGIVFEEERQKWQFCKAGYYIGWEIAHRPRPADLERVPHIRGHDVKLQDGCIWKTLPVRQANGDPGVPQVYGLDDKGEPTERVAQQYQYLWERCGTIFEAMSGGEVELSYPEALTIVGMAMGVQYFLSEVEIRAAEMCTTDDLIQLCEAICDMPTFARIGKVIQREEEDAKKKLQSPTGSASTTAG